MPTHQSMRQPYLAYSSAHHRFYASNPRSWNAQHLPSRHLRSQIFLSIGKKAFKRLVPTTLIQSALNFHCHLLVNPSKVETPATRWCKSVLHLRRGYFGVLLQAKWRMSPLGSSQATPNVLVEPSRKGLHKHPLTIRSFVNHLVNRTCAWHPLVSSILTVFTNNGMVF